jgi:hypothetical protein
MTGMQTLDLSNNHWTGAFRLFVVYLFALCVGFWSTRASLVVPDWRSVWR